MENWVGCIGSHHFNISLLGKLMHEMALLCLIDAPVGLLPTHSFMVHLSVFILQLFTQFCTLLAHLRIYFTYLFRYQCHTTISICMHPQTKQNHYTSRTNNYS